MKPDISSITKALEKSVIFSFANLVFVDIEDHQRVTSINTLKDDDYVATIKLNSPITGSISLLMNKSFSERMADIVINVDSNSNASQFADAMMAEISNTIAGRFMAALVPEDTEFGFGLPNCSIVGNRKNLLSLNGDSVTIEFLSNEGKIYCTYQPMN